MIDWQSLVHLKVIAIRNKLSPDSDTFYKMCCKHYSKTYHTPLKEVYKLNPPDVIMIYWEDQVDELSEMDLKEELQKSVEDRSPLFTCDIDNSTDEGLSDDEWIAMQERLLKEKEEKSKKKVEDVKKATEEAKKALDGFYKALGKEPTDDEPVDLSFD